MDAAGVDLRDWIDAEQWRAEFAPSVFRTPAAWSWFKRRHREELVEAGVLILGAGRVADTVHAGKIAEVVQRIRQAESLSKLNATPIAA